MANLETIQTSTAILPANLTDKQVSQVTLTNHRHTFEFPYMFGMQSMPDYANAITLSTGDTSYVFKVNVPGYIMPHFGHCSDIDYVLWCSYDAFYLHDIKKYHTQCFKLGQGYGNGDRDESSIFIPIFPGKHTYVRPTRDYSSGNVGNMKWLFIPCMLLRRWPNKKSDYIVKVSDNIKYTHVDKNTTGLDKIALAFDTLNNPNCWLENIGLTI